jgi:hypothetical protein
VRRLGVLLVAMTVALAAGCGGGGGGGKKEESGPSPRAVKWSGELCAALDEWTTAIGQRMTEARSYDQAQGPSGAYNALVAAASGSSDATNTAIEAVDAAGEPPVDDGVIIAVTVVDALRRAQTAFSTAQTSLQALSPNDPAGLIAGAEGVRVALLTELSLARNDIASALAVPTAQELSPAFAAAPACDGLIV